MFTININTNIWSYWLPGMVYRNSLTGATLCRHEPVVSQPGRITPVHPYTRPYIFVYTRLWGKTKGKPLIYYSNFSVAPVPAVGVLVEPLILVG